MYCVGIIKKADLMFPSCPLKIQVVAHVNFLNSAGKKNVYIVICTHDGSVYH